MAIERIRDLIKCADYYEPFNIENCLPDNRSYRYSFIQNHKQIGLKIPNVTLSPQYYLGAKGNVYFVWKEDRITKLT